MIFIWLISISTSWYINTYDEHYLIFLHVFTVKIKDNVICLLLILINLVIYAMLITVENASYLMGYAIMFEILNVHTAFYVSILIVILGYLIMTKMDSKGFLINAT